MSKANKLLTCISAGIITCIPVCFTSCSLKANETEVHILHINDIHGQIPGYGDDFYDQAATWAGAIRLGILGRELGHTPGLGYTYTGSQRGYQADTIIEQAGAWSQKSQIAGFNTFFKNEIDEEEVKKVSVGIISPDSVGGAIPEGEFLVRDCYKIFQFENHVTYGVLTYSQLEQLCNYLIAGKTPSSSYDYNYSFYYDHDGGDEPVYESSEEYTGMPWNPYQWYGFSFAVTDTDGPTSENNWRQYEYTDNSLKVYDPDNGDLEDPTTWKDRDNWENNDGTVKKYIAFTLSNFNFDYETGALNVCELWGKYNANKQPGVKALQNHAFVDVVQRQLVESYCESLVDMEIDVPLPVLGQLIVLPPA